MYENRYYVIIKAHDHNETITKQLLSSLQYRHGKVTRCAIFCNCAQNLSVYFTPLIYRSAANRFTEHQRIDILTVASITNTNKHRKGWQ